MTLKYTLESNNASKIAVKTTNLFNTLIRPKQSSFSFDLRHRETLKKFNISNIGTCNSKNILVAYTQPSASLFLCGNL